MVLRSVGGHLLNVGGHLVANDDCCCDEEDIPCNNCDQPSQLSLAVSGFTALAANLNGFYTLTWDAVDNRWEWTNGNDVSPYLGERKSAHIICNYGTWQVIVYYNYNYEYYGHYDIAVFGGTQDSPRTCYPATVVLDSLYSYHINGIDPTPPYSGPNGTAIINT